MTVEAAGQYCVPRFTRIGFTGGVFILSESQNPAQRDWEKGGLGILKTGRSAQCLSVDFRGRTTQHKTGAGWQAAPSVVEQMDTLSVETWFFKALSASGYRW